MLRFTGAGCSSYFRGPLPRFTGAACSRVVAVASSSSNSKAGSWLHIQPFLFRRCLSPPAGFKPHPAFYWSRMLQLLQGAASALYWSSLLQSCSCSFQLQQLQGGFMAPYPTLPLQEVFESPSWIQASSCFLLEQDAPATSGECFSPPSWIQASCCVLLEQDAPATSGGRYRASLEQLAPEL